MTSSNTLSFLFLLTIRIALYSSCRLALPFLFSEARQLSFDPSDENDFQDDIALNHLPTPSTTASSSKSSSSSLFSKLVSAPESSSNNHHRKLSTANHGSTIKSAAQRKADLIHAASALLFSVGLRSKIDASFTSNQHYRMTLRDFSLPTRPSLFVFTLHSQISFEESAFLFVLVLLEAAGFDYGLLRANWNFSLVAVIALGVFWIRESVSHLRRFRGMPFESSRSLFFPFIDHLFI